MSALTRPIHKRRRLEDSQVYGLEWLDLQFTPFLVFFLGDREGRSSIFEARQLECTGAESGFRRPKSRCLETIAGYNVLKKDQNYLCPAALCSSLSVLPSVA